MRWLIFSGALVCAALAHTLAHGADEPRCAEDFNADHWIDISDVTLLLGHYGEAAAQGSPYDLLPADGYIDISDLTQVLNGFGAECHGWTASYTQPATVTAGVGSAATTLSVTGYCQASGGSRPRHPYGNGFAILDYRLVVYCFVPGGDPLRESIQCVPSVWQKKPPGWVPELIASGTSVYHNPGELCISESTALVPLYTMLRMEGCWQFMYWGQMVSDTCRGQEFWWMVVL